MNDDWHVLSDGAITQILGQRLRALRLRKNMTIETVAQHAAISKNTISALEAGRGKLETLIAVLRELDALSLLDNFLPEPAASPMAAIARHTPARQRARPALQGQLRAIVKSAKQEGGQRTVAKASKPVANPKKRGGTW